MNTAKIVGIHGAKGLVDNANPSKPLDVCLVTLRDSMKSKIQDLLRKLFENADDALFALADKAGSNSDQSVYFDAMRELRLQRKQIATEVVLGVIRSFNELGYYRAERQLQRRAGEVEELSLVENDELELNVAIEGMVNRLRHLSGSSLTELHLRIGSLILPLEIAADQTPASPEILCDSFVAACKSLDIEIRVRLVVFKLFEKYVLADMAKIYGAANQLLIKQGVNPDLKHKPEPSKPSAKTFGVAPTETVATSASPASSANLVPANLAAAIPLLTQGQFEDGIPVLQPLTNQVSEYVSEQLDALRALLHCQDGSLSLGREASPSAAGMYYSQSDLVSALSACQRELNFPSNPSSDSLAIDFRRLLNGSLSATKAADYSDMDSDVINLVAMLFEFILDDRQLQPEMKALISRLQIPLLKVALIDRSFFSRGGHPARKLLNEMASAAIGWNEKKDGKVDPLKDKIEQVVRVILNEFEQNVEIFATLLEDFSAFVKIDRRRGQLVEQRTKDSEHGRAASDAANQAVQNVINRALKGKKNVPECAIKLLRDGWSRLMALQYLKEGEDSDSWKASCALVNDLVWTVSPEPEESDTRTTLLRMIPCVIKRLREGLHEVSFDEFRLVGLLKDLEDAQVDAIHRLQTGAISPSSETTQQELDLVTVVESDSGLSAGPLVEQDVVVQDPVVQDLVAQDQVVAELVRETLEMEEEFKQFQLMSEVKDQSHSNEQSVVADRTQAATAVQATTQTQTAEPKQEVVASEEIILASLESPKTEVMIDETDPFVQQVNKLSSGCWFEFQNEGRSERCKLAAVIRATGKYIFVNRSGVKVAEKTKMGLAVELRRGSVQILNDGLLFDRALESVISNLRGRYKAE